MAYVKTFRDLVERHKWMELSRHVYRETAAMPASERFGLTNQMRRSSHSIPSNIAEGFGRETRKDLIRFLRQARGSLYELDTQIELAASLGLIKPSATMLGLIQETDRVLQGLIRSLQRKKD